METLLIVCITSLLGYSFSNKENIRNIDENEYDKMPLEERPNSTNIYNSNKYNEVNDTILEMSVDSYKKSEDPKMTGVLPPIYNTYSMVGSDRMLNGDVMIGSISELKNVYDKRYEDGREEKPLIVSRPMFNPLLNLDTSEKTDFSNFGQGDNMRTDTSILTGEDIIRDHNNMVPFFGSNVKQNVEKFTNVATLDLYTGNKDTFIHKSEQGPIFNNVKQDIYGGPQITTSIDLDRYIPSLYKQGEKPFVQEQISAPIARTIYNPVTVASGNYPTIDELRTDNNPHVSYEGRTIAGQFGNVRGLEGKVEKNKVDTHFELGESRFFTSTGAVIGDKSAENYSQMQPTSRQSQNVEYYGGLSVKEGLKSEPRYVSSFDNSNELTVMTQENTRQQLKSDYKRNVGKTISNKGDYGKSGIRLPELERDTTNKMNTLNINKEGSGSKMYIQDDVRNTIKETTLYGNNSGNIKSIIKKTPELTKVGFKTTQKETTINNKYPAQPNKNDQMGYTIMNYDAKTTNKETVSDKVYDGHASTQNAKNTMVYSTYFNPEKVRNPSMAIDYMGQGNFEINQSEHRERFSNAEINENASRLVSNERPSGPTKFNIAGGVNTIGATFIRPNKEVMVNARTENINNISNVIPSKSKLGKLTHLKQDEIQNQRENGSIIQEQLKNNPFALRNH